MDREGLKILLAFDGSDLSLEAVNYVAGLMPAAQTEVVLFYVETQISGSFWKFEHDMDFRFKAPNIRTCITEQHKRINASLEKAQQILLDAGFPAQSITTKIQAKNLGIVNDIVRESHEGYDAVVMGRTGESKVKDMLIGSVPNRLMHKIQGIPMIIVGGAGRRNRILVAFDGSKEVMRAVRSMSCLLGASDCKISFCHVFKSKSLFKKADDPQWKESERKRLEPMISKAKESLIDAGFAFNQISCEVLNETNDLSGEIVHKAHSDNYDTIVIGRRGLSVYQEFLSRRVGEKIFQQAANLTVWVFG